MDFPVEATVHLNTFPKKVKVREILCAHDLELKELSHDQVRVKGSFMELKAAKASLEQLLTLESKIGIAPSLSSPVSSGAIPKQYGSTRGRSGSRNKPPHASPSSPSPLTSGSLRNHHVSPEQRDSFPPRPGRGSSFRPGTESFLVDADVFLYADKLRRNDIGSILMSYNVKMQKCEVTEDNVSITLIGKNAKTAAGPLQRLLDDLRECLRSQEVPLKDMDNEGWTLLEIIKKHNNIYNSVLVCQKTERLHLIGSSVQSYELKQRLLGKPVQQSRRTGRTLDKNTERRSRSLPPMNRRNTEGDRAANPSPGGANPYSPLKYQDDKPKQAQPEQAALACEGRSFRRRSQSESRKKPQTERANGYQQDTENKPSPTKAPKGLKQLLNFKTGDIKLTLNKSSKRKK
ncbi:uncharacterized protein LOC121523374 [Cheilinus undulatus]|uniref:uncharacterized protein LOC121523374 n=1 Tax=Cheilinus undulatus TaxID=241271 RepID=UPI001BD328F1|nr:uncharacterized protein LOC121523374 [Cheilinus undulatus]